MKLIEMLSELGKTWTFVAADGQRISIEEIAGIIGAAEDTAQAGQTLVDVLEALGKAAQSGEEVTYGLPEIGVPEFDQLGIAGTAQTLGGKKQISGHSNFDFDTNKITGTVLNYSDGSTETRDLQGRTTWTHEVHPGGGWTNTQYEYDDEENPNHRTRTDSTSYDRDGNKTSREITNDEGTVTEFYDENGKITDRATTSADGQTSTWERYDQKGNLIERSVTTAEEKDGVTIYTTKTYDGSGKLVSETTKPVEHEDAPEDASGSGDEEAPDPDDGSEDTLPRDPNDDTAHELSDAAADALEAASGGPGAREEEILTDPDAPARGTLPEDAGDESDAPAVPGELILVDPDAILFLSGDLPDLDAFAPGYGTTQPGADDGLDSGAAPPEPETPWSGTDFTDDTLIF